MTASATTALGTTRTSNDVSWSAAARGIADIKRILIRSFNL